jgi:hypothetical protein
MTEHSIDFDCLPYSHGMTVLIAAMGFIAAGRVFGAYVPETF